MRVLTRSVAASAVALATMVGGVSAPLAGAAPAAADTYTVTSGELDWPIKESWINYMNMKVFEPTISATDGATYVPRDRAKNYPGTFKFELNPAASTIGADGNGTLAYKGDLHFLSHPERTDGKITKYMLDVEMSDIKITIADGTKATLTMDIKAKGAMPGAGSTSVDENDAAFASFTLDKALSPSAGAQLSIKDQSYSFEPIVEKALLAYQAGPVEDGRINTTFTVGDKASGNQGDNTASGSSTMTEQQKIGAIIGGVIGGVLAILGAAAAAIANGLIPGLDLHAFGL
ncbi:HtaA domain-containing protein [Corynebacterium pyruviciproducens]